MSDWRHKRSVKRRYDFTAKMYDARYAEEQEAKYRVALACVEPEGLVLDVGCGTGLFFQHVHQEAANIVGIDASKNLLHLAFERAKTMENVSLVQADADHLPFQGDTFDEVFAFTVLQNMPNPIATLKELHRTARTGADVTVTGLKKTFLVDKLKELLSAAKLRLVSMLEEENLACYVALTVK